MKHSFISLQIILLKYDYYLDEMLKMINYKFFIKNDIIKLTPT